MSNFYDRMIEWRERHISEKDLVLLLSFFVGAFSAAAAAILKSFIHLIQWLVEEQLIGDSGHTWWYLITPIIGITLAAIFVKYIVRDDISHGITKILYAISQRKSIIKAHNMWSSIIGSGLTIGFGGSVGEEKNNDGKRIIVVWDVVNEACTDGNWADNPLRTSSPWYSIYGDDSFIVNAFRFANKYAPADVQLAYNDYSCYSPAKTRAICKIVQDIQADPQARIDVVGMQSHVSMTYPAVADYEKAVNQFLSLGVDVQVTELEIAFGGRLISQEQLADRYAKYFQMFLKNRKQPGRNGISGVTLWGTKDEVSWIRNNNDDMNRQQRPLLFEKEYECKPAFFSVLETAQNYSE